jgi:predicted transcriptional regulator
MPDKNTTVRLDEATRKTLDRLAALEDRSRAWVISQAIRNYLDHQDWMLERIDEGIAAADRGDLVPHDKVMAEIDELIAERVRHGTKS